jgi:hypothetical protein
MDGWEKVIWGIGVGRKLYFYFVLNCREFFGDDKGFSLLSLSLSSPLYKVTSELEALVFFSPRYSSPPC